MAADLPEIRQKLVLTEARKLIGTSYDDLDCSHFVCEAYKNAGYPYEYANTASFVKSLATGSAAVFIAVPERAQWQAADVILVPGHMGLWDPEGCSVVTNSTECTRIEKMKLEPFFLSSRSPGKTLPSGGPEYGVTNWWKGEPKAYRYRDAVASKLKSTKSKGGFTDRLTALWRNLVR